MAQSDTNHVLKASPSGPLTREQYYRYRGLKPETSKRKFKKLAQNNIDPRGEAATKKTFTN